MDAPQFTTLLDGAAEIRLVKEIGEDGIRLQVWIEPGGQYFILDAGPESPDQPDIERLRQAVDALTSPFYLHTEAHYPNRFFKHYIRRPAHEPAV